ncbi:Wall-associated receptor kinase, partial [Thalictrum thalictroides]
MGFHSRQMILHVLVLWICAVLSTDAQNNQVAKPGCQSRCGNFSISYPFGIGKQGCYRDEGFEILCKSSEADKSIEAPFLGISDIEIVEISLLDLVRVRGPVTSNCYSNISLEEGRGRGRFNKMFNLSASPFTISDSHNKLFAVGCDVFSYISDPTIEQYISGCASLCPNNSDHHVDLLNGSCFGIGCCQTTIPKGFKMINLSVDSINRRTQLAGDSDFNRCSFAALLDYDPNNLNSNASSLVKALNHTIRTSTVTLDWAIGNTSCQNLSTGDECGSNSNCEDSITGFGYHCRCLRGFEGNPYLGCQDIDECKLDKCPKGAQCFNSEGGYECKRPPGYLPDTSEACFPGTF